LGDAFTEPLSDRVEGRQTALILRGVMQERAPIA
jgi:hypothetical protein